MENELQPHLNSWRQITYYCKDFSFVFRLEHLQEKYFINCEITNAEYTQRIYIQIYYYG